MKLLVPMRVIKQLERRLRGRIREVGGVMVGEHVAGETFRIVDMSLQRRGGSIAHFVRDPAHHRSFLADFFSRTGNDYRRFNYIGEWHSHPLFRARPSGQDAATMYDIVQDPDAGVNFAVLVIAKLKLWGQLELSATLFRVAMQPEAVSVETEEDFV